MPNKTIYCDNCKSVFLVFDTSLEVDDFVNAIWKGVWPKGYFLRCYDGYENAIQIPMAA